MFSDGRLRILMIEDNRIDREIYKQCLSTAASPKFEFAEADSAAAGIELARTFQPDCVILDYNLPDQNGLEVLGNWSHESHPAAIVMLTAFGGEDLAVRAMKAGATDYLPKRLVNSEVLAHTVANAIEKVRMERRMERHRAALERSERRYETLLEAIPQMVWTANSKGVIQYANRHWLEYTGLPLENTIERDWDTVLHAEDRQRTLEAWRAAILSGSVFEIEHRLRRASDRSFRWHLVRAVPMKNGAPEGINWFGTCTEVENQKQAEKAARDVEKMQGLAVMAGGIAHDFNNLLTSILGNASFAMDSLPTAHSARGVLKEVIRAGQRAAELTRKMLSYSGRANLFFESVDAGEIAREICDLLRPTLPGQVQLHFEGACQLAPVETDAAQLRQVIIELVMNAAEAIGEGPGMIWVRAAAAETDPPLDHAVKPELSPADGTRFVALEVHDTGCGMDEGVQMKIFDPFFSTKFTGRGMGLSAVKGFIRSNGGAVRVRSILGEGTIFRVLLPASGNRRTTASGNEC
jgi:two-component system cell cycle sensor histidine kinase/response regulator CckA